MAAQLLLAQLFVAVTALIVNVFAARALGPAARGELALFMQIAYVANTLCLLGRYRAYLRFRTVPSHTLYRAQRELDSLSILPMLLAVGVSAIVGVIAADSFSAGFAFSVTIFVLILSGVQQKMHRTAAIVAGTAHAYLLATILGQLALLAAATSLAYKGVDLVTAWLAAYGLAVLLPYAAVSAWAARTFARTGEVSRELGPVSTLGYKLTLTGVGEIIGSRADRFLIPIFSSYAQLGVYTVVVTMTELVTWPIKNYADARVPIWTKALSRKRFALRVELIRALGLIVICATPLGFGLWMILVPLFGSEYSAGLALVLPLTLAAAFNGFSYFGMNLSIAAGFSRTANLIPISAMVTAIAGHIFFIPTHGAQGAAWSMVAGYSVAGFVTILTVLRVAIRLRKV
ncbi:hypothetical protein GCM10027079_04230 [Sediminivirga luteola]|uniref:O-antigen/teichoic acid export membrane protein n=1 Tax=Sediminivirga luteola TaxID=1774748 RepID=A0A8J2TWT9_9MICO|nr:hypothetical protein [Sediminivirga luteola]GGA09605.1 hypothetical protein GCM10011333_10430 [Sediminivirga luteola]